jgi:hypothetical protein
VPERADLEVSEDRKKASEMVLVGMRKHHDVNLLEPLVLRLRLPEASTSIVLWSGSTKKSESPWPQSSAVTSKIPEGSLGEKG